LPATNLTEPWTFRGGATPQDVYLRFRTGMNGTPMPSFVTAANEVELRNLAAYVLTLARKPVWEHDGRRSVRVLSGAGYRSSTRSGPDAGATSSRPSAAAIATRRYAPMVRSWTACSSPAVRSGPRHRFGDFVSYNLTSDKRPDSVGGADDQIKDGADARDSPDGSRMLPYPMPWPSYASLTASDLNAVGRISPNDSANRESHSRSNAAQHRFVSVGQVSSC
jgi:hypothetical protein